MRSLVVLGLILSACHNNNGTNSTTGGGGMDLSGVSDDGGDMSGAITCGLVGDACAGNADCCSNNCDPSLHICLSQTGMCKATGDTCTQANECCTLTCNAGTCGGACVPDNMNCANNGDCCSQQCVTGMCMPLPGTCSTAGNPCTIDADAGTSTCCSGLCKNGTCNISASYCTQVGDICFQAADCCTGICTKAAGVNVGTCGALNSPVSCTVDGTVCSGCGNCCSRLCAPYAASGVDICQPAGGCHVYGDLCRKDSDCCGGEAADAGLPGAGRVQCQPIPGAGGIGFCGHPNGMACDPEGNVCHFKNYACNNSSDRNDCCACISSKGCCQLDPLGIPRCNAINPADGGTCVPAGGNCSFSGDCCGGLPCVPDSTGQLKCGVGTDGGTCVPKGGPCTSTADCCPGVTCIIPPGALAGTCDVVITQPPDAGPPGSDMAGPPPVCAEIGQSCASVACCTGLVCEDPNTGLGCGSTGPGCVCVVVVK
jgi:hypothetical protein